MAAREFTLAAFIFPSNSATSREDSFTGPPVDVLGEPGPERPLIVNVLRTLGFAAIPFTTLGLLDDRLRKDTWEMVYRAVGDTIYGVVAVADVASTGNALPSLTIRAGQLALMSPWIGRMIDRI